jgi:hypothetical protein
MGSQCCRSTKDESGEILVKEKDMLKYQHLGDNYSPSKAIPPWTEQQYKKEVSYLRNSVGGKKKLALQMGTSSKFTFKIEF